MTFGLRRMGLIGGIMASMALSAPMSMKPVAISKESGIAPAQQTVSKKAKRSAKRARTFGTFGNRYPRTRNAPPKRQLKRNLVRHGARVRRKHRRAA